MPSSKSPRSRFLVETRLNNGVQTHYFHFYVFLERLFSIERCWLLLYYNRKADIDHLLFSFVKLIVLGLCTKYSYNNRFSWESFLLWKQNCFINITNNLFEQFDEDGSWHGRWQLTWKKISTIKIHILLENVRYQFWFFYFSLFIELEIATNWSNFKSQFKRPMKIVWVTACLGQFSVELLPRTNSLIKLIMYSKKKHNCIYACTIYFQ